MSVKVAIQGDSGCYSEIAARACFQGKTVEPSYFNNYDGVFQAIESGNADVGFLPLENTISGTIYAVADKLMRYKLHITGEFCRHDDCCLMALPGTSLESITQVLSHSSILDRCESYLSRLNASIGATPDTAGAAKSIKERNTQNIAAIASAQVAATLGLEVLEKDIDDDTNSSTRYILLEKAPKSIPPGMSAKTSIAVSLRNQPGALFRALAAFALRGINVTKLDGRPSSRSGSMHLTNRHWEYINYIDIDGSIQDEVIKNAVANLEEFATDVRVLGSYPLYSPPPENLSVVPGGQFSFL